MQTANVILSLAGDSGNTVPKYKVTAAEIAVLRAIHGADSVTEIEPADDVQVSNRDELARLRREYPARDTNGGVIVNQLYPGAAARVFENLDELDIPENFFKAEKRAKPKPAAEDKGLDDMTKDELVDEAKKRGVEIDASAKKAEIKAKLEAAQQTATLEDDGVEDMNDDKVFG